MWEELFCAVVYVSNFVYKVFFRCSLKYSIKYIGDQNNNGNETIYFDSEDTVEYQYIIGAIVAVTYVNLDCVYDGDTHFNDNLDSDSQSQRGYTLSNYNFLNKVTHSVPLVRPRAFLHV